MSSKKKNNSIMEETNLKSNLNYSTVSLMSILSNAPVNTSRAADNFDSDFVFCLTEKSLMNNKELMAAIQHFSPEYTLVETQDTLVSYSEERRRYFFVCTTFEGKIFSTLKAKACRICAPPFLIYLHLRKRSIPKTTRSLYNGSMFGVALCFTGFAGKREWVNHLADLVHYMGGSVRKDLSGRITHMIANIATGQKYKSAVNLGKNIMTEEWILKCWENRHTITFKATEEDFMNEFLMKPFYGLKLSFYGFPDDEMKHMQEITEQNGGVCVPFMHADSCTHLVVEEECTLQAPLDNIKATHVIRQEWFWASIQLDACAEESMYFYITEEGTPLGTASQRMHKKRKHLNASDFSDIFSPNSPYGNNKRQSREGRLSTISSATFESSLGASPLLASHVESPAEEWAKPHSARYQRCVELQQTERNYVDILRTVIKVFKIPLEESISQRGGGLLAVEEMKTIFGAIPDLLETHEKLLSSLDILVDNWTEEALIGEAVNNCAESMMRVYPGFVNFFEMIKETIVRCDKERPRFHAFLKICKTKADCGRQSLTELLIRPVQRLPSMSLLLNDILKKTEETNPDYTHLTQAVSSIKSVLTHVNEDKRKTENRVEMFEIMAEVENCPPYLLSSHRSLSHKADVVEAGKGLLLKQDHLMMFLFNDCIEIASKLNRAITNANNNYKSPAINIIQKGSQQKSYKHVEFIPLANLKAVVDIKDHEEHQDLFGLVYHEKNKEDNFLIYKLVCSTINKQELLDKIIKCVCETQGDEDIENLLESVDASELCFADKNETNSEKVKVGYLQKALKKCKGGISKKVSRVLSQNKTPKTPGSRNASLKRMVSITPMNDSFKNLTSNSPQIDNNTTIENSTSEK